MQMGQKYGNGFGSSPSVPVLIEIPNFMIEIWKIVRHHVLVPRPDSGHPNVHAVISRLFFGRSSNITDSSSAKRAFLYRYGMFLY